MMKHEITRAAEQLYIRSVQAKLPTVPTERARAWFDQHRRLKTPTYKQTMAAAERALAEGAEQPRSTSRSSL